MTSRGDRAPRRPSLVGLFGVLLTAGVGAALPASAQETIASDRPGIGSASVVVSPGILQAEFGAAYQGGDGADAVSLGQLFIRYGLGRFELELLGNSWVHVRDDGATGGDGFQDLGVGTKVRLAQGIGGRADLSLQGLLSMPTGSEEVGSDEWVPALVALSDLTLGGTSALGLNLGYQFARGPLADVWFASVTPSLSVSGSVSVYGGWAGSFSEGGDANWLEGGAAFLATPDLQLDVNGASSPDTDQWFLGVGVAVRTGGR